MRQKNVETVPVYGVSILLFLQSGAWHKSEIPKACQQIMMPSRRGAIRLASAAPAVIIPAKWFRVTLRQTQITKYRHNPLDLKSQSSWAEVFGMRRWLSLIKGESMLHRCIEINFI